MMRNPFSRRRLEALALGAVFAAWLAVPGTVADAAGEALGRCGAVVVPTLFPFFVLSNLFVRRGHFRYAERLLQPLMGPLFGLRGGAAGAVVLGAVGGYPVGAATVFRLYDRGRLDNQEAARALAFCNNAGPGFVLGVAGLGLFGSVRAGLLLWGVHLLSAVAAGLLLPPAGRAPAVRLRPAAQDRTDDESFAVSLVESVRDAAGTIVQVCAFLVFFAVVLRFVEALPVWDRLPAWARPLAVGSVELSTGVARLGLADVPDAARAAVCAFLLGWGGACVHCQVLSLRGQRPISMAYHTRGKLLQGLLSAALVGLLAAGTVLPLVTLAAALAAIAALRKRHAGNRAANGV